MKTVATACLLVAAVLYVVTFFVHGAGTGYVRAAAEAAMVGGLADWFAITALFRRPLGLAIPHTALIPSRKDALAQSLGAFMTETFLTRENVGERLADADVVRRVAGWLADPANAHRVGAEAADIALSLSQAVEPLAAAELLLATARTDAARRGYAPLLGRLLETTVKDDGHQALTDIALRSTHTWMVENRQDLVLQLKNFAEDSSRLLWLFATTKRVDRMLGELMDTVGDAARDRHHPLRRLLDRFLLTTAKQLQSDDDLAARVNEEALRVLNDPALRDWLVEVIDGLTATLQSTLADPEAVAIRRLTGTVVHYAQRVLDEPLLRLRLDALAQRAVFHAVDHYADEFTALVVDQVARWDGVETARRIELLAGRDLQFIRINGTVVGALAGLAIHAASTLLP
ncbi:MAG TPA: DUF445 domain-containing protein [Mycobacteriales bacterium]|jgi:uncharacterized membrane-anchored protein YjiN (DUF445 family)|nr:DUF445 domain-containing protein [Mycobacteriales bacterium]